MSQRDVERSWTLDLFSGKDIEQLVTVRDVEAVTQRSNTCVLATERSRAA